MPLLFGDIEKNLGILKQSEALNESTNRPPAVKQSNELHLLEEARKVAEGVVPNLEDPNIENVIKKLYEISDKEEEKEIQGKVYFGSSGDELYYAIIDKGETGTAGPAGAEAGPSPAEGASTSIKSIKLYGISDEEVKNVENTEGIPDADFIYQIVQDMQIDSISFKLLEDLGLFKVEGKKEIPPELAGEPEGQSPEHEMETGEVGEPAREPGAAEAPRMESVKEAGQDVKMFEKDPAAAAPAAPVKEMPKVMIADKEYYVDNQKQQVVSVDNAEDTITFDDLDQETLDQVIELLMTEKATEASLVIGFDPAQKAKNEAKETKKDKVAAAERTKHAMSFLRKIHKATEASALETVMDALEKAATKGDIDDKQETRLKDAWKRRKEALASDPKAPETEPTKEEEKDVEASEAKVEEAIPQPKVGDGVERRDTSKVNGNITKIIDNDTVEVDWGQNEKTQEKIKDLALVSRNEGKDIVKCRYCGKPSEDKSGVCAACEKKYNESKVDEAGIAKLWCKCCGAKLSAAEAKEGGKCFPCQKGNCPKCGKANEAAELSDEDKKKGFAIVKATGKAMKDQQQVVTTWMKELEDGKEYEFLVRNTPFGRFWLDVMRESKEETPASKEDAKGRETPVGDIAKTRQEKEDAYQREITKLLKDFHEEKINQIEYDQKCEELKKEHEAEQVGAEEIKNPKEVDSREKKGEIENEVMSESERKRIGGTVASLQTQFSKAKEDYKRASTESNKDMQQDAQDRMDSLSKKIKMYQHRMEQPNIDEGEGKWKLLQIEDSELQKALQHQTELEAMGLHDNELIRELQAEIERRKGKKESVSEGGDDEDFAFVLKIGGKESDLLTSMQDVADKLEDAGKKAGDADVELWWANDQAEHVRDLDKAEVAQINALIGKGVRETVTEADIAEELKAVEADEGCGGMSKKEKKWHAIGKAMKKKKKAHEAVLKEWKGKLRTSYDNDIEDFKNYDESYGIAKRLGFASVEAAWEANPTIHVGTNLDDLYVIKDAAAEGKVPANPAGEVDDGMIKDLLEKHGLKEKR
jgi:hypothetical protein